MNDYYDPLTYVVSEDEEGWLLKTVLQRRLHMSRSLLAQVKRTAYGILLNGERVYINVKVTAGDMIDIRMMKECSDDILPQPIPFHTLYEDEYILIVNKAAGIVVHPTQGHYTNTLANGVVHHWQQAGVKHRFRPIHRLDQHTSGVIAIAKNRYIHHVLSESLKLRQVERHYIALVHGNLHGESGTIDEPIDRDPVEPHRRIVTASGYPAVTHYEVLARFAHMTMIQVKLETGRTHQIRVHLRHIGHPLLGDPLYGLDSCADDSIQQPSPGNPHDGHAVHTSAHSLMKRQALHASKLTFIHPMTKQLMTFVAPLPQDMELMIANADGWR